MYAYKFDLNVDSDGKMTLPQLKNLINKDVEVIIVPEEDRDYKTNIKGKSFIDRWSGIISEAEVTTAAKSRFCDINEL